MIPKIEEKIGCVDSLIGERLREAGIRCPCPLHTPPGSEPVEVEQEPPTREDEKLEVLLPENAAVYYSRGHRRFVMRYAVSKDAKERAANDDTLNGK